MRRERMGARGWIPRAGGGQAGGMQGRSDADREPDDGPAPPPGTPVRPALEHVRPRGRLTGRAAALVFLAVVAPFVVFVGWTLSGRIFPAATPRPTIAPPATVDSFTRLDAAEAYVVAGTFVYTTGDGGSTWTEGHLPVPDPIALAASDAAAAEIGRAHV